MLTIIATPIGNLKDITLRALETLQEVDGIICEDSRRTSLLLQHYQINKPLIVLNDFNEAKTAPMLIQRLQQGENFALVSDAGTPLVADPGYKLVRDARAAGVDIDSLPGPSAAITALTLSGLPPDKFIFLGYLPEKPSHMHTFLANLSKIPFKSTYIVYCAPHKLVRTLEIALEELGEIEVTAARELTKMHQDIITKTLSQWLKDLKKQPPKGEYTLLFNIV